ncbi:MAG: hypothetical protein COW18_10560 [Zetaproteobacteria bacterium CG12_big_fil_rev_8_21_14_0_65_54_13]|nr:MAG: hypothetical protein COW18_10560 [Zetaproteobacteria bacterium CG12_big_fil_rev_8_21_14_0_65_54_13]PIX55569.1 MAG: hypothetical protein COZ50_02050 [Zetaproteobacteria bacterium CG_4_10_14_3_um_filter_54_28]PJA29128.1 MAG: hypothetical protein CO188_07265 [Zetaproteobacteria bacterium CG_4_9_14_3_um_filter_54_145]
MTLLYIILLLCNCEMGPGKKAFLILCILYNLKLECLLLAVAPAKLFWFAWTVYLFIKQA